MTIDQAQRSSDDWRQPPVFRPAVRYMTRYWKRIRGAENCWWDGMVCETPKEATEWITKHRPEVPFVVVRVTTTEELVDTRAMHYDSDDPHYGIELRALDECPFTQSHTREFCGYEDCRES